MSEAELSQHMKDWLAKFGSRLSEEQRQIFIDKDLREQREAAEARAIARAERRHRLLPARFRDVESADTFPGGGLYVFGPLGTGKTTYAASIVARGIEDGVQYMRWVNTARWLGDQREAMDGATQPASIEDLAGEYTGLLVIDDIGVEAATPWMLERLYCLVDAAYLNCVQVLVTSNLRLGALKGRVGPRIVSRLAEMCETVEMGGSDRRLRGNKGTT